MKMGIAKAGCWKAAKVDLAMDLLGPWLMMEIWMESMTNGSEAIMLRAWVSVLVTQLQLKGKQRRRLTIYCEDMRGTMVGTPLRSFTPMKR